MKYFFSAHDPTGILQFSTGIPHGFLQELSQFHTGIPHDFLQESLTVSYRNPTWFSYRNPSQFPTGIPHGFLQESFTVSYRNPSHRPTKSLAGSYRNPSHSPTGIPSSVLQESVKASYRNRLLAHAKISWKFGTFLAWTMFFTKLRAETKMWWTTTFWVCAENI